MIIFLLEILGTVAFSIVGASVAIRKGLDIFGILLISVVSATGGGIIRDLVLGNVPPITFRSPFNITAAILSGLVVMLIFRKNQRLTVQRPIQKTVEVFDAIGLSVFTINGIDTALGLNATYGGFLLCFVGVVTAVGGGIMRDILVGQTPAVLKKEIYATASIIGSIFYIVAKAFVTYEFVRWAAILLIIAIRLYSQSKKWNLPVMRGGHKKAG